MTDSRQRLREELEKSPLDDVGDSFWECGFRALGSECEIFFATQDRTSAKGYRDAVFEWLADFEARCSRFLDDSEISRINANAGNGWTGIHAQTEVLLDLCGHYHFVTGGAFDATSLPLSKLWDWKRSRDVLPTEGEVGEAMKMVGWNRIQREPGRVLLPEPGMQIDLGGIGKEFAVDCLTQMAGAFGILHVMVDLGGDIAVLGEPPEGGGWYIGLEDPANRDSSHCGIRLRSGGAVATSGDYRRCFQFQGATYGHILDCRTGWPVANGTRSVTVIAPRCTMAGVLSTSAMILGGIDASEMLDRTPNVEGCLWHNGQLCESRGFRRSVLPQGWEAD